MNKDNWVGVKNISVNNGELVAETGHTKVIGFNLLVEDDEVVNDTIVPALSFLVDPPVKSSSLTFLDGLIVPVTFDGYEAEGFCEHVEEPDGYVSLIQMALTSMTIPSDIGSALVK